MVPPMSTTTASPAARTRPEGSWCGLAAFGPDPTITKSARAWPSATIAAAMSAATSRSVRPGRSQPGTRRVHPVDRRARLPQRRDLGRGLAYPQPAQGGAGQPLAGARQRVAEPEHHHGPHLVRQPDRLRAAEPASDQARTGRRSRPSRRSPRPGRRRARPAPTAARAAARPGTPARRPAPPGRSAARSAWRRSRSGSAGPARASAAARRSRPGRPPRRRARAGPPGTGPPAPPPASCPRELLPAPRACPSPLASLSVSSNHGRLPPGPGPVPRPSLDKTGPVPHA